MKKIFTYISVFLFSILSTNSIAQITVQQFVKEMETKSPVPLAERLKTINNPVTSTVLDDDDLLLASRTDQWENEAWLGVDSVEYTYNQDNQQVELLFLAFDNVDWNNANKVVNEYNMNSNLTNSMNFAWDGMAWDTVSQSVYEYNVDNQSSKIIFQLWDGMAFNNVQQVVYGYDNDGNQNLFLYQTWNGSDWTNIFQTITEYNMEGQIISEISQNYNTEWENSSKSIYEYDPNGNRTLSRNQVWLSDEWKNTNQNIYTFDANDNEVLRLKQDWNGSDWFDVFKEISEYNANNDQTLFLVQDWDGFDWTNTEQQVFVYDSDILDYTYFQIWDGAAWENVYQDFYEFDAFGNVIYVLSQENENDLWVNISQQFFYYQIVTGSSNPKFSAKELKAFPNPNNGIFTIDLTDYQLIDGSLKVFNSIGQLQHFQTIATGNQMIELNVSHLQKGIYFLQLNDGSQQFLKAIQILK